MARASANCKGWAWTGKALDYATRCKIAHVSCIVGVPNKALEQPRECGIRTAGRRVKGVGDGAGSVWWDWPSVGSEGGGGQTEAEDGEEIAQ
jgi:hypothetical protein